MVHQYSLTDWFKQVLPRGKKELPISKVNIGCNQTISFVTLTLTFVLTREREMTKFKAFYVTPLTADGAAVLIHSSTRPCCSQGGRTFFLKSLLTSLLVWPDDAVVLKFVEDKT